MATIIGLAGYKRSGKDTAGAALWLAGFHRVAFADAIREEAFAAYPEIRCAPKDEPIPALGGNTVRDLLIKIGQQRRQQDPDYWIKIASAKIADHLQEGRSVVVTDVRLPAEVNALRSLGAHMLWVARPGVVSSGDMTEQDISHLCDGILYNDCASAVEFQSKVIQQCRDMGLLPEVNFAPASGL